MTSIEKSKERLRKSLSHLEDVVEKRLKEANESTGGGDSKRVKALEKELTKTKQENEQLHTLINKEKQASKQHQQIHQQVSQRVDKIIAEVEGMVKQNERVEEHASG